MNGEISTWPDEMDAVERVRHVALTRTSPRNAGWIADEADVSRDTAVKYLSRMADRGELQAVETEQGTSYKPDEMTQFLREVRELAETNSLDELTRELDAIAEEIATWKETYDVDSLAELRQSVGRDDLDRDERQDRLEVVGEWEYNIEIREALQVTIRLKDSFRALESDALAGTSGVTLPQER